MCGPAAQVHQRGTRQVRADEHPDESVLRQVQLPDEHHQVHVRRGPRAGDQHAQSAGPGGWGHHRGVLSASGRGPLG